MAIVHSIEGALSLFHSINVDLYSSRFSFFLAASFYLLCSLIYVVLPALISNKSRTNGQGNGSRGHRRKGRRRYSQKEGIGRGRKKEGPPN